MTEYREIHSQRGSLAVGPLTLRLLPVALLINGALLLRFAVEPWIFMWVFSIVIFLGCKWLTLLDALNREAVASPARALSYLFLWPGMDARAFLAETPTPSSAGTLIAPAFHVLTGLILSTVAAPWVEPHSPWVAGWVAMWGLVLVLHFGLFQWIASGWRRAGVNAVPLMREPLSSASLAEFWGERWNTAFHVLAHRYAFRPLVHKAGLAGATVGTFLASGVIHDAVISFPAGGGYGKPTLYFLIQGAGVLIERTTLGRRMGLRHGLRGRVFTLAVIALPLGLLFHPEFIERIMLPMLHALALPLP